MKQVIAVVVCALGAFSAFAGDGRIYRKVESVPNQYIVTLRPDLGESPERTADVLTQSHGGGRGLVWGEGRPGFVFRGSEQAALALARNPNVETVEEDGVVHAGIETSTAQPTTQLPGNTSGPNYLWNLDRIDQRAADPLDNKFLYCGITSGVFVKIYIVDYGVVRTHSEFSDLYGSRVVAGVSTTGENYTDPAFPGAGDVGTNPCGIMTKDTTKGHHGTWVASVAAGHTVGVAKAATIVPVKVLPCAGGGTESMVTAGLSWILAQHRAEPATARSPKVVNMSIFQLVWEMHPDNTNVCGEADYLDGYGTVWPTAQLTSMEWKVRDLVREGVTVVASANNQNIDARYTSPARLGYGNLADTGGYHTITVGGTMLAPNPNDPTKKIDTRWLAANPVWNPCNANLNTEAGSNWGPAVDIFAPSYLIPVANPRSIRAGYPTFRQDLSGTSFAAPMVAGAIAQYLQGMQNVSALSVWNKIKSDATRDVVANQDGTCPPWETCNNDLVWTWGLDVCPRLRPVHRY